MNITRRTATVVIYQGDDLAQLAELRRAADDAQRLYDDAQKSATRRIGDAVDPQPAKDAYDAYIDEAAERAVEVQLQAIGRRHWRDLVEKHPPRETDEVVDGAARKVTHDDDEPFGVNTRTFPEELLAFSVDGVRTIAAPEFNTPSERQAWLDDISEGDFDRLWATAYYLNTSMGVDPKGSRFSAAPQSSSVNSE